MVTALPAADPASPWMKHLERAHSLAHEAARVIGEESEPSPYLAPAARHLERGCAALYDAFDGRSDRITAMSLAHGRLWEGAILVARAGLSRALTALCDACAELVAAEERFPRVALAARTSPMLQAGVDVLPLHVLERASTVPSFRAPPAPDPEEEEPVIALPDPKTFEDLAAVAAMATRLAQERVAKRTQIALPKEVPAPAPAVPPLGFTESPPPALPEDVFIQRWTRHCFEEIGMLGLQRTPLAGDDWRTSATIERRLIHAVDAIAALGPGAVAHLEPLALDAPVANPMTVFAISLLGGCLEGRDVLGSAERVLHRFGPNDPLIADPFVSAMKLAPNPFVPGVLRSLLASSELGCRAIAVEVLAYRGWLTESELGSLAEDDDPRILALVLPALAIARHRELDRAIHRALAHPDLRLQEAALDAMALAAHPDAAAAARTAAAGSLGDPALVRLALVADEQDARWLLARAKTSPTASAIDAVGWAGLVEAVPVLLEILESGEDDAKLAAGAALERLLGANLIEAVEIPPDAVEEAMVVDPDPDPPKPRPSLANLVSQPRDLPPAGSTETLEAPSTDPVKWRAYWAEHGRRLDPKQRLRRGHPYSPSVSLYELDRLPLAPEDRRRLHRELAARTGKITWFDPHDLVVVQERSLAAWGALLKATAETPGAWGRVVRR
ncbi:MAG: hypothetical protein QM820_46965 [Minicystis sp.]